jgi:hypothetical protein
VQLNIYYFLFADWDWKERSEFTDVEARAAAKWVSSGEGWGKKTVKFTVQKDDYADMTDSRVHST